MLLRITSKYPKEEVEKLIRFAAEPYDLQHVIVNVKNSRHAFRGRAYPTIPRYSGYGAAKYPRTAKRLVVIAIGPADKFPLTGSQYGGKKSPIIHYASWQEAMVGIAAHEFHHIRQFQNKSPLVERYCERASLEAIERYREQQEREAISKTTQAVG